MRIHALAMGLCGLLALPVTAAAAPSTPTRRNSARQSALESTVAAGRAPGTANVDALVETLRSHRDPEVRARAAWALGQSGNAAAVQPLSRALRDDGALRVRRAAALALGTLDEPGGRRALVAAIGDEDEEVAAAAVEALGNGRSPQVREVLLRHADDERPLVAATARRALAASAPSRPAASPPDERWRLQLLPCTEPAAPAGCIPVRDRSGPGNADPMVVLASTVMGGLAGTFALDALRPERRVVRFSATHARDLFNDSAPLERALMAGLGTAAGAGLSTLWVLADDVTPARATMAALFGLQGMALGAAASLGMNSGRNASLGGTLTLGLVGGAAGLAATWVPGDFSPGDVAWVAVQGALGVVAGTLGTLVLVPSAVGRLRGREGFITDVADLFSVERSIAPLPFGAVGRTQAAVAVGLLSGVAAASTAYLATPLLEFGVSRSLRAGAAALLAGALVFVPFLLVPAQPPSPLPTPERVGALAALAAGASAGAVAFAVSPNDEGMGPLVDLVELAGPLGRRGKAEKAAAPVQLLAPTVSVTPPMPGLSPGLTGGPGVYVGMLNGRF